MSLGVNAVQACPSDARRRHHAAHGQICLICEPDAERPGRCPTCWGRVRVVGVVIQPHSTGRDDALPCPGAGGRVRYPRPVDRPIWVRPAPGVSRQRSVALVAVAR